MPRIAEHISNAGVDTVQSSFARKEKKYVLQAGQYRELMARIGHMLEEEPYPRSIISSLYYDTPSFELINRSMEKPVYKEKLRIRSYGAYNKNAAVFCELKKKFKGIVYKRRVQTSQQAAYAFMGGMPYEQACAAWPLPTSAQTIDHSPEKDAQIAREIEACIARHEHLMPAMMVQVDRLPLHTIDGSNVRITFDFNPIYRTEQLRFSAGVWGEKIMDVDEIIMEVKCQGAYPLWLTKAFDAVCIYPQGCSKYGRAYVKSKSAIGAGECLPLPSFPQVQTGDPRLPLPSQPQVQTSSPHNLKIA